MILICSGFNSIQYAATSPVNFELNNSMLQKQISGTVIDNTGSPMPGVSVLEKGTTNGKQTDFDGKFTISVGANATLTFSYLGYKTEEVVVGTQTNLTVTLEEDATQLDEIIVVGYGTQKKVNLTAAVSVINSEIFENRPTANAIQSLQGSVPGLVITNSSTGGEPGTAPNINIRGYLASTETGGLASDGPLILVDGIRMSLNNINPEDIESVSVLKDASAAAVYGSQASGGAILITTKSGKSMNGKMRVNYSNNFSLSQPTKWPKSASPIDFAYTVNDARINNRQNPYHDETDLANILANMENPGSAPSISANAAGTNWSYSSIGIDATGATNWDEIIFKDWAERTKHDFSITGGTQKLNYYISAGAFDEGGLLAVGNESFQRYNLDSKIGAKATDWLEIELITKYRKSYSDFPTETSNFGVAGNKSRVLDLLSKLKPTLPQFDPIYGEELLQHSYYPFWDSQRAKTKNNQLVISPRLIIKPVKGLKIDAQFNYRRDDNLQEIIILSSQLVRPAGIIDRITQENTSYSPSFITNEYFSPNIFATYDASFGDHNFQAMAGYQSEESNFHSISASAPYLATDNFISISTSLDQENQTVNDALTHWATQGVFGRFRYNYNEKYLFEFSGRMDYSSRFEPDLRNEFTPSFSAGWNIAKEEFWPLEDINMFKLRGSYGETGNQNVSGLYGYISSLDVNQLTTFLFDGTQELRAPTPILTTENLSWEVSKKTDIGFDMSAFNNKLGISFSWYRSDTDGTIAPGFDLPAQLGTSAPLTNIGITRVQGIDLEINWRQQINENFSYNIRAILGDYQRTVLEYPNDTNFIGNAGTNLYAGRDLGEIWGYQWDGWFLTDEEAANHPIDQSAVTGWAFSAGDTKYKDLNGDGVINQGSGELGDNGDFSVIGNSTPRYQYGITFGFNYKNLDFNAFVQGVGKRDVLLSNHQRFRGPAQGPFHINVWEEHLDYFRPEDTTSPLGPNTDAYFPAPYTANPGRNNKNYARAVDRYIQNGAYTRLKSLQFGYTIPKDITNKYNISNLRLFFTGENLFTISDLMFFDPEVVTAGVVGSAQSYPLSKIISWGLNVSF
ncbi:TonB-dependent receptor [uncultured Polaribacter sp.]|uniref:SusC/RagA family TonB-linked outer membrane protein n=1 Tax=uncultured Polaribacter sp. TaxID=174711 RepID=UPI002637EAC0|nr:TonB-dependent receptor [uncultured Polaribacter sp.]